MSFKEGFHFVVLVSIEANNFLLWATPTSIYYYPLANNLSDPKTTSEPQLLPISSHGDITAVTYHLRNESVVWLDGSTNALHRCEGVCVLVM